MKNSMPFKKYYSEINPIPFYVMIGLFVFSNMLLVVNFIEPISERITTLRLWINAGLLVLCVMYMAFILLLWRLEAETFMAAAGLIALVGFGWNFIGQTNEFFCTIVAALLAVLAYQRDFRMILKIVLVCHLLTMIVGAVGLPLGFTELAYKVQTVDNGFSMGLIYPNHVGRMMFLILVIAWYLWGQSKRIVTTIAFFIAAVFNWRVVNCRTIVLFLIGFPICWWGITFLQKFEIKNKAFIFLKDCWDDILMAFPFVCMLFTYIMGRNRAFFMTHWHFGQGIYALWMRFISAGILFKVYGFPLFGRDILEEDAPMEFNAGQFYIANIIDNAYIYYLIAIGGIALIACMLWLSFGAYRAFKNNDLAFLLIYFFMCGYGIIEIVFFQFEHNFLFFYPLTATAMAYKKAVELPGEVTAHSEYSGKAEEIETEIEIDSKDLRTEKDNKDPIFDIKESDIPDTN